MKLVFLVFLSFSALASHAVITSSYDPSSFDQIEVKHTAGDIGIKTGEVDKKTVVKFSNGVSKTFCKTTSEIIDRTLFLKVEKIKFVFRADCEQSIVIQTGNDKKIKISLGSGDIILNGVFKSAQVDLGAGNIKASGLQKKIDFDLGAGDISVVGLDGYAKINVASGSVDVKYLKGVKNPENRLFINKAVGNTNVQIPKDLIAKTSLKTFMGSIKNGILSEATEKPTQLFISVKTSVGDISTRTY